MFSTQVVKIDRARLWTESASADSEPDEQTDGHSDAVEEVDTAEPEDEEEEDESRARLQQALNQMLGSSLDLGSVPLRGDGPEDGLIPADKVVKKKRKAKKKKTDSNPGMFFSIILWEALEVAAVINKLLLALLSCSHRSAPAE